MIYNTQIKFSLSINLIRSRKPTDENTTIIIMIIFYSARLLDQLLFVSDR